MREIKFRAWDGKRMTTSGIMFNCSTGFLETPICAQMKIMQFTGLTDKNGVQIFEGDFDKDYQVVRWCDNRNGWAMSIYDFPTKEHICCHCYECDGDFDISEVLNDIEIIGNIYENNSLL